MNKFTEQAEEAIELFNATIAKKIETMPEFKEFCDDEMEKILACYPMDVRKHVEKMKSLSAFDYIQWASKN